MKKFIVILLLSCSLLFSGVAIGESINGSFNGNPIVRVLSGDKVITDEVPAQVIDGKTMVPLTMLRQFGADITWNQSNYSVNVSTQKANIRDQLNNTNGNVRFFLSGSTLTASSDFIQRVDAKTDWEGIWNVIWGLSNLSSDQAIVNYIDKNNNTIGKITIQTRYLEDFKSGKLTVDELSKRYTVYGVLAGNSSPGTNTPLTTKEIAKLMDRVGYVVAFNKQQYPIGQGSGFMIKGGVFITNYHVAGNNGGLEIQLDGTKYNTYGEYLFGNSSTDVFGVVIATQHDEKGNITGGYPSKVLDYTTKLPEVGDKVYAIGSPKGLENTLSEGIVSGIRNDNGVVLIQHTANTDHGSSGGVLLNEYGQAMGITSSGYEGTSLNFSIPMMYVQQELDKIINAK